MSVKYYFWHWLTLIVLSLTLFPTVEASAAPPTSFEVAETFQAYYNAHQGMRVLGYPLTDLAIVNSWRAEQGEMVITQTYPMQYFEKGRIEDHRWEVKDPNWQFMYGRLTDELMERDPYGSVNATSLTYRELKRAADPGYRQFPPPGFGGGVMGLMDGIFVPYDPYLRPSPGYIVPPYFWVYINRLDLFPGAWLHDIGLPMTRAFNVETDKFGLHRTITIQAFERAVLTYDPLNSTQWQVERGNIGSDAMRTTVIETGPVELPAIEGRSTIPLHVMARLGVAGEQVTLRLRWLDGPTLTRVFTVLRGEDGRGLVIANLDWGATPAPPQPPTQLALLEISNQNGKILSRQLVTIVSDNDPATMEIMLYWVVQKDTPTIEGQHRHILSQPTGVMTEALKELLWGPPTQTNIGFRTALPTPPEVLSYPGRDATWGPRVILRKLTVQYGITTVDLSREFQAFGGDFQKRLPLIYQQISRTLYQFPGVTQIYLTIEGKPISSPS